MKRTNLVFAVVLVLVFSGMLLAQPGMRGPMDGPPEQGLMPHLEKMLDLSDEQAAQIADLRLQMAKEMLPLRSDMVQQQNELKLLITADKPDQTKINKTIGAISDIRQQMQEKRVNQILKVRSLLTVDQKKQFDAMILKGGRGMMGRPHRMERDFGPDRMRGPLPR